MKRSIMLVAIAAALTLAGCGAMRGNANDGSVVESSPAMMFEGILIGPRGMTLYIFDKDAPRSGKSACNGVCAANWPAFAAPGATVGGGDWTVIARDDGTKQWAYKGKPLYYFGKDQKPGDRKGEGFNGVWHAAKP